MGKKLVDEYLKYNSMMSNPHKIIIPIDYDRLFYESYIKSHKAVPIDGIADYKDLDYILIKNGQYSVAIEDIKFDGSSLGKGSKNDKERFSIERDVKNHKLEESDHYCNGSTFHYDFSIETYINRFKENFDEHYKKIQKYHETLNSFLAHNNASSNGKLGFYLHDDFYQPVLYEINNEKRVLSPLVVPKILIYLRTKNDVDFVIISHYGLDNIPYIYFLNLKKESIDYLLNRTELLPENATFTHADATHYYASISQSIKTDISISFENSTKKSGGKTI
ncbi:hypothetical protein N7603_00560 [Acholeplasma vituli]|uniref:Uncharacterized protein n=1 Tax=Paracholeplasma vituli TaxID=69473 RepID=A0ABT2PWQ0_9MOLU|nr:hypothetical protein [Paracholeplasma vituli]MCU0104152.1 hypothetical protein [Paracholeplasma vituli]